MTVRSEGIESGVAAAVLGVLACFAPAVANAAYEVGSYAIDDFEGGNCGGDSFNYAASSGYYFRSTLYSDYSYDYWMQLNDSSVLPRRILDASLISWGKDHSGGSPHYGADVLDIMMFYSHGGYNTTGDGFSYVSFNNNAEGPCAVQYGADKSVHWGDSNDLNVAVIETCNSVQREILGTYFDVPGGNFSMLLGYHGLSYDSSGHYEDFKDWVDVAEWNGLGDDFVDLETRIKAGSNNDTCAAAFVFGQTSTDRDYVYQYSGFRDFKVPTSHNWAWMFGVSGCDPDEGMSL